MNFMRLLAAGRSVIGIKKDPGPYKLNQEHLLPKFAPAEKGAAQDEEDRTAAQITAGEAAVEVAAEAAAAPKGGQKAEVGSKGRVRRLFLGVGGRLARLGRRGRVRDVVVNGRPVQAELSLDTVRVVRNDLTDSDYDVVPRTSGNNPRKGAGQQLGMVWNRLSARLLRQAVQDFNVVQKQRGKLLSQTGSGSGGAGGA